MLEISPFVNSDFTEFRLKILKSTKFVSFVTISSSLLKKFQLKKLWREIIKKYKPRNSWQLLDQNKNKYSLEIVGRVDVRAGVKRSPSSPNLHLLNWLLHYSLYINTPVDKKAPNMFKRGRSVWMFFKAANKLEIRNIPDPAQLQIASVCWWDGLTEMRQRARRCHYPTPG